MANDAMQVLILTADQQLTETFTDVCKQFAIAAVPVNQVQQASDEINRTRYQGFVLDFDTVPNARLLVDIIRASPGNRSAVLFTVASSLGHVDRALSDDAHFLLRRPIQVSTIRKTIRNAYDLLTGKHRREFRCPASLRIRLTSTTSGASLECSTVNISSNGLGVTTPSPLKAADVLDITLTLPDGSPISATGIVIWDDQHGKSGLSYQCKSAEMREKLDSWLDSQFEMIRSRAAVY